jgi:hypothetical protein
MIAFCPLCVGRVGLGYALHDVWLQTHDTNVDLKAVSFLNVIMLWIHKTLSMCVSMIITHKSSTFIQRLLAVEAQ